MGQAGTLLKKQGSHDLDIRLKGTKGISKQGLPASKPKGLEPIYLICYSILLYYSPVKPCQESTCQNVVFPPDKYKHRKISGKPYNVQRKAT